VCQYPKGLGSTVPELKIDHAVGVYDKTRFSMIVPPVESLLPQLCNGQLKHVVLFGIEVQMHTTVKLNTYVEVPHCLSGCKYDNVCISYECEF